MIRQSLAVLMILASVPAFAQSDASDKAVSLDELLRMVEQARLREAGEQREREQRFAAAQAE